MVSLEFLAKCKAYEHRIEELASNLQHLVNVRELSIRHQNSPSVTCYDVPKDTISPLRNQRYGLEDDVNQLASLAHISDHDSIRQRIIIVEDLTHSLILALGSLFDVNP